MNHAQKVYLDLLANQGQPPTPEAFAAALLDFDSAAEVRWQANGSPSVGARHVAGSDSATYLAELGAEHRPFVHAGGASHEIPADGLGLVAALTLWRTRTRLQAPVNQRLVQVIKDSGDTLAMALLTEMYSMINAAQARAMLRDLQVQRRQLEWAWHVGLGTRADGDRIRIADTAQIAVLPNEDQWSALAMLTLHPDGLLPVTDWAEAFPAIVTTLDATVYSDLLWLLHTHGSDVFPHIDAVEKNGVVPAVGSAELVAAVADLQAFAASPLQWVVEGPDRTLRHRRALHLSPRLAADLLESTPEPVEQPIPGHLSAQTPVQQVNIARWIWANHSRPTAELVGPLSTLNQGLRRLLQRCATDTVTTPNRAAELNQALRQLTPETT